MMSGKSTCVKWMNWKQSAQNAVFEHKRSFVDLYKLESFNLFKDYGKSYLTGDVSVNVVQRIYSCTKRQCEVKEVHQPLPVSNKNGYNQNCKQAATDDIAAAQTCSYGNAAANAGQGEHKQQQVINTSENRTKRPLPLWKR